MNWLRLASSNSATYRRGRRTSTSLFFSTPPSWVRYLRRGIEEKQRKEGVSGQESAEVEPTVLIRRAKSPVSAAQVVEMLRRRLMKSLTIVGRISA